MVRDMTKPWADKPFQLLETPRQRLGITNLSKEHGAITNATSMALIHNVFIRILNCMYLQAPNVKNEQDIADFAIFMHSWVVTLHEHHRNEEKIFFPLLEEYIGVPDYMHKNVEQHHAFTPGLDKFEKYINALREKKEPYDGAKVTAIIDEFGPILVPHLADEIASLEALESFGDKIDWVTWAKKVEKIAVDTADHYFEIPVILTNMDFTFEPKIHGKTWPPVPWLVRQMFRWFYIPKHKGAWRFSCCDDKSMPKDLELV